MEATATYKLIPVVEPPKGLTAGQIIGIAVGIALLAGAVIVILVIIAKKRKRQEGFHLGKA